MTYPSVEAIIRSCPPVKKKLVNPDQAVQIIEEDQWEEGVGKAKCAVDSDTKIRAKVPMACRGVTAVEPTGCPLRDTVPVKVKLK